MRPDTWWLSQQHRDAYLDSKQPAAAGPAHHIPPPTSLAKMSSAEVSQDQLQNIQGRCRWKYGLRVWK